MDVSLSFEPSLPQTLLTVWNLTFPWWQKWELPVNCRVNTTNICNATVNSFNWLSTVWGIRGRTEKNCYTSVDGGHHSLWWGRSGSSWTSSEPWSRCMSQRTRWRTSGWCQACSHRPLRPAALRTSHTAAWSGTPRWHSLAGETRTKGVPSANKQQYF